MVMMAYYVKEVLAKKNKNSFVPNYKLMFHININDLRVENDAWCIEKSIDNTFNFPGQML